MPRYGEATRSTPGLSRYLLVRSARPRRLLDDFPTWAESTDRVTQSCHAPSLAAARSGELKLARNRYPDLEIPRRSRFGIDALPGLPRMGRPAVSPRAFAKALVVALSVGLLAVAAYRAGQGQLAGFGAASGREAIGFVQIGNDVPGQTFDLAVDRF